MHNTDGISISGVLIPFLRAILAPLIWAPKAQQIRPDWIGPNTAQSSLTNWINNIYVVHEISLSKVDGELSRKDKK